MAASTLSSGSFLPLATVAELNLLIWERWQLAKFRRCHTDVSWGLRWLRGRHSYTHIVLRDVLRSFSYCPHFLEAQIGKGAIACKYSHWHLDLHLVFSFKYNSIFHLLKF